MIVESPNKVRKIREILGAGWDVAASVGHIRDLPVKDLGIAMPGYQPQYELSERGADVVKRLRALAAKAKEGVYLATDPDREGEAIAWHLSEALKLKRAERVTFDAITPEVIRRALERPRAIDTNLVHAQEARRVLDRLVGYQVSPVLSRQTAKRGLSAGRVQSPAVRLVVDREREIETFIEVRHFGAELRFDGGSWRAQWEPALPKGEKYCLDEALATRAASCRNCTVTASANRIVKQPPPPPFTTSTMLQAASVRLRWKPDVTAFVAQKLFEGGLITYHRTDSQNFSAEALKEVRAYAKGRGLPLPDKARSFRSRGSAQEAHEAIRPTHFESEQAGEDPAQQALYRLIWQRAVASQLADAEWSVNTTRLSSSLGSETFAFKAEGRLLAVPGWKALTARDAAEEDDEPEGDGRVPVLAVGALVKAEDGRVLHKKTEPPLRYTQATLIKKLESMGIGRPSTYPAILKNVQTRGYLEDDKKYLRPTELGFLVVDALVKRFSFVEYAFTRDLEQQLDEIAEGKAEYLPVVAAANERLQQEIAALGPVGPPAWSPGAGTSTTRREFPKQGFIASRTRPENGSAAPSSSREAVAQKRTDLPVKVPAKRSSKGAGARKSTGKHGKARPQPTAEPTTLRAKTRGKHVAEKPASVAPAADAPAKAPAVIPCPLCKAGFVRLPREDSKAWGCSQWSETKCPLTIWRTMGGRELKASEVSALCRTGRTDKLSGFRSMAGRPFEAALALNGEGKAEFSFR